jgi:23S rRNA A2030 N6-methylase RlmJ
MANRHFGKITDVWKHGVLAEALDREPPARYAETHAGSGAYTIVHDREREFGILRFLEVAPRFTALARSPYRAVTASYVQGDRGLYPGSALQAMTMLGDASSYLLCDLDPESITDLRQWSHELGLHNCEVAETDGMAAVAAWLDGEARGPRLVHIDPFDPDARVPGGYSALELAARVADSGTGLVYWYGYNEAADQAWALNKLATLTRAPLWCGDLLVTGASNAPGDLGRATTPGTGFGVILANLQAGTIDAGAALGEALSAAYADAIFPDGHPGRLAFTSSTSGTSSASPGPIPPTPPRDESDEDASLSAELAQARDDERY